MGFARCVHDVYLHIADNSRTASGWLSSVHLGAAESFNSSKSNVVSFFTKLKTGAYVRYTKTGDPTPSDGRHSIVFVKAESEGVWVYECNQDYAGDECAYYGCGVFLQYYDYDTIAAKYLGVLHYVNHSFADTPESYNILYHNVGCANCDGFVRQLHTKVVTKTALKHIYNCSECEWTSSGTHTYSGTTCTVCGYVKGGSSVIESITHTPME